MRVIEEPNDAPGLKAEEYDFDELYRRDAPEAHAAEAEPADDEDEEEEAEDDAEDDAEVVD
jgi:hypothetical protein